MKPAKFKEANTVFAEHQPEYQPLPAFRDEEGEVISCWELSDAEVAKIAKTKMLWLRQLTFNSPLQPILPTLDYPFKNCQGDGAYLFFDTETIGLPADYKAPSSALENWPRAIQIAWVVADEDGNEIKAVSHLIKPNGFEIPEAATEIHGITTEMAIEQGVILGDVVQGFIDDLDGKVAVAHNISFDRRIVGAELIRCGFDDVIGETKGVCTMTSSVSFCKLPSRRGYKWPTLSELHFKLFGESFEGAHDALVDVRACARCFFELKRLGVIGDAKC